MLIKGVGWNTPTKHNTKLRTYTHSKTIDGKTFTFDANGSLVG